MSDGKVVALVPVTGRGRLRAPVAAQAFHSLTESGVIDHIVVVSTAESEKDIVAGVRVAPDVAAAVAELDTAVRVVLVYDPSRSTVPDATVRSVVAAVVARGVPVVPVFPCSDTVKRLDADGFVVDTPDRAGLRVVLSPIGYPADAVRSGSFQADVFPVGAHVVAGDPA